MDKAEPILQQFATLGKGVGELVAYFTVVEAFSNSFPSQKPSTPSFWGQFRRQIRNKAERTRRFCKKLPPWH